ncbi:PTS galactitol transporter subunit IIC [Oceanobacillus sp. Castelsardo]|uniref:PTS galactitol transporter subunit IIC n=1 Tax=Oceanobacillus sp. Castelsardo TaxID=1851204 RepID=UPI000838C807|nr:PTS transporter subunit IIC [Oceanobacillus sp. Castelsardo]
MGVFNIFDVIKQFFDTFGAPVFVPIIIFIIALFLKVPVKKAFMSALTAGVGLMGFTLVINAYAPIVTPIVNNMVENTGVDLPVFDIGWQTTSIVAYSTEIGIIFVGVCILLQTILFLTRYTNVFQPGDLWNNYSYMVWGSMIFLVTGNIWLGIACMIVQMLFTQLFAEMIQKRWSTYYKYPNCTLASLHTVSVAPYAIAMDWILNKFGLYKIKANPQVFKKKLGFIGEPMTLGLFLGLFIGIIGNLTQLNELASWGQIATCGIATAAVMAVFPKISAIFAGSFTAITESSKKSVKGTKGEWYLSVNDAAGYGESATLISGIIMMPIVLLVAFVLPGNQTLPMIDLVALPYLIQPIIAVSNGNIFKTIISGSIWFSIALLFTTWTAPVFTSVASEIGVEFGVGIMLVTSLVILGQPIAALIFFAFVSQSLLWIGLTVSIYVVGYVLLRKKKHVLHEYLERKAVISDAHGDGRVA